MGAATGPQEVDREGGIPQGASARDGGEDGARGTPRLSLVQTVGAATGLLDVDREGGIPQGSSKPHGEVSAGVMFDKALQEGKISRIASKTRGEVSAGVMSDKVLQDIKDTVVRMFAPDEDIPEEHLGRLAREAVASTDGSFGVKEAVRWADGFTFPQSLVDSDLRLFRASGLDFTRMVERRMKALRAGRLSKERVEKL